MLRAITLVIGALSLLCGAQAEVVTFGECKEGVVQPLCEIHEVRISPCPEAAENGTCKVHKGKPTTIEFDYTPKVAGVNPQSRAFWVKDVEMPFMDMPLDACLFTQCPIVKDQRQHYSYSLTASKKYPERKYDLKWKLWNKDEDEPFCCITLEIEIPKKKKQKTYESSFT